MSSDYKYKDPSNVALNKGHKHTDDFITRKYVLPLLTNPEKLRQLIEEHRANPIGTAPANGKPVNQHSQELQTVLDKLRRQGMAGKYVTVCAKLHEDYRIAICSGVRGKPLEFLDETYSSEEAAEHAIFLKRINDLLNYYKE